MPIPSATKFSKLSKSRESPNSRESKPPSRSLHERLCTIEKMLNITNRTCSRNVLANMAKAGQNLRATQRAKRHQRGRNVYGHVNFASGITGSF